MKISSLQRPVVLLESIFIIVFIHAVTATATTATTAPTTAATTTGATTPAATTTTVANGTDTTLLLLPL